MVESQNQDIPQVTEEENNILTATFTEREIIKKDLLALFTDFFEECLLLRSLNFGVITLLPKMKEATKIQQYRPIYVLNVSYKIFTKVAANRLMTVASKVVRPSQTAFMPGRNIMEGQTLRMKGFCQQWCLWTEKFVTGGSVGIKVNDDIGHYFQSKKGLRQGDPMSPILFNIVAEMLSILIKRAKDDSQIIGIIPHLVDDGLQILRYADDTIIFIDHDLEQAKNMKLLLCVFEQLSGLKINFHKSEIFYFGEAKHFEHEYAELFGCAQTPQCG
ncbi:hypothetical protein U9M48_013787 [Paspalum notatum var. saurae]|uniref:Reverse transcriptase domain-containing protein n=1 Tax=Paspalum notatum var. saurae TaxID=547442 RepID=A0AAQ3T059_PASNO